MYKILISCTDWDKTRINDKVLLLCLVMNRYVFSGWRSLRVPHGLEGVTFCVSLFSSCPGACLVWFPHQGFCYDWPAHMLQKDFNGWLILLPTCMWQAGSEATQSYNPQTAPHSLYKVAKMLLMASYSSDKGDDHPNSIKFHFCPLSISGCNTGPGSRRWGA